MYGFDRMRHYSSGSDGSDKDYGYAHNPEFLVAAKQRTSDKCTRCDQKIYPTEKIDVGIQLHKRCFRCKECDLTLNLNNFILAKTDETGWKDVFCKSHAPKLAMNAMDPEAIGIKNAVNAQQLTRVTRNQGRMSDQQGWEYDPRAMEFEHVKELGHRNKFRRPLTHDMEADAFDYEQGQTIRKLRTGELERDKVSELATALGQQLNQNGHHLGKTKEPPPPANLKQHGRKFPTNQDYMEPNCLWSPRAVEDPWNPNFFPDPRKPQRNIPIEEPIYAVGGRFYADDPNPYGNLPKGRDNLPNDLRANSEGIYERLRPVMQAPELPPKLPPRESPYSSRFYPGNGDMSPYDYSPYERDKPNFRDNYPDPYRRDHYHHRNGKDIRQRDRDGDRGDYDNIPLQMKNNKREFKPKPYFKEKAFIAQNELEMRQKHEQFEMWGQIEKARESQIQSLEKDIRNEMEKAVQELFMHMDAGMFEGDLDVEKMKIEEHFQRLKGERMRSLLSQLTSEERMRLDDMIDTQTQDMLCLIDKKVPTKLPSPVPPKRRKHHLYSGPKVFDDVDFVAMQVAQHEQASFTELVYELTRNCKNQLEKARSIFRWLAVKDLNQMMFSEDCSVDSPYYFLRGIKYGIESYHELFKRLCSYAGIPVKIIRGVSKSAGYRPGALINSGTYKNSWAVVYIDGDWRFVDCHWGARHVMSSSDVDQPDNFCYAMDEFYFLTDPDEMIFMHYPDDPAWQLLKDEFTVDDFIRLPLVKSQFFQYGLKFTTSLDSIINTDTGLIDVVLKKIGERYSLAFNTRLEQDGEEVDGYCIHHFKDKEVIFDLSLPKKGVFYFTIFACDKDKADSYSNVCSFRIVCSRVENKPFCKFPKLPDGYGPTPIAADLGLSTEKYSEYYLVSQDDKLILNLKFRCPVKCSQKLVHADDYNTKERRELQSAEETDPDRLVFQRYRDHSFVSYLMRFKKRGIYVFSIFAGYRDNDSSVLECACRYLIQCNAKCSTAVRAYPKTLQYWKRCRLHEPTTGDLKLNKNVKFKLEVPSADAVAVIVKDQWFYLKKDSAGKVWEGVAHTGKDASGTVDVYYRGKDNARDFYPLLEYKILKDD